MANINRDYLIVLDAKSSVISDADDLKYYITDEHSQNLFINLVVRDIERINKYVEVHDPEKYQLELHIVKPNNDIVRPHLQANLLSAQDAIYAFELPKEATDYIGTYKCELRVTYQETDETTITTSNKFKYKVKRSIYNDLDSIQDAPQYPVVIQLFDKLSDINQYEEDRRANELARQLAEQQRQTRFDTLDADMVDKITAMDNKMVDVENRVSAKEQAVDTLIADTKADIDGYKVAKDQEIDNYKATKDTEINEAIASQNTVINAQNDRIIVVENNVVAQNDKIDALENKGILHESRLDAIEAKNTEQDSRLDVAENRLANIGNDITNTMQPIIDEHTSRLEAIEAIDISQNNRLDAIEAKNQQQDDRLLDIEKVNKQQAIDIKCLFTEAKNNMMDITEEGNNINLQNSTEGHVFIDEIKGNTLVNCNKEPNKELILNGNINTSGDNAVTITEGVDGGKVDVALEGNTLVNVSKTKDSTPITKAYTVENSGNHIALQGDVDGKCRPIVTGNTLWIDNDTEEVLTAFDEARNLRLQSSFEDNLITQEMVDSGEEVADNLGKYKVQYKVTGKNKFNHKILENCPIVSIDGDNIIFNGTLSTHWWYKISLPKGTYVPSGENTLSQIHLFYKGNDSGFLGVNNITYDSDVTLTGYIQSGTYDNVIASKLQIEEGDTATSYEPYKEYTKTLYLNSPLLEGDTIEEKDGGIYHVHRSKKIDSLFNSIWFKGDNFFYSLGIDNAIATRDGMVHCDKIPKAHYQELDSLSSYGIALVGNFRINLSNMNVQSNTLEEFNQWLRDNNPVVVYELASPTYELIEQSNLVIPSYANGHLDFNTAVPVEKVDFLPFSEELTYLYANTQYAVQFVSDKAITADITLGGTKLLAQSIVAGLNRITITTPATLADNKLVISGVGANISEVVVTNTNREFGYFEGMKSVGECEELEVKSSNKNLVKPTTLLEYTYGIESITDGVYTSKTGGKYFTFGLSNSLTKINPIMFNDAVKPITKGNTYTISCKMRKIAGTGKLGYFSMFGFDKGTNHYKNIGLTTLKSMEVSEEWTTISVTSVATDNADLLITGWQMGYDAVDIKLEIKDIQVEEGSTVTDYIPHQSNTQQLTHEPLRAVGDVKDRYVLIDGKWYIERNCKEVVLDGSNDENWQANTEANYWITSSKGYVNTTNVNMITDRFKTVKHQNCANGSDTMNLSYGIRLSLSTIKATNENIPLLRQYLQQNPITVVYQLAEPQYELIDYNPFEVYSGTTHITTNSTIPCNIIVKNHGFNCLLKPSTTYTISSNLGLNTVTAPSTLTEDCLRFMDTDTSDVTTMRDVLVLEGDWTTKADLIPANFSGIESAFEQAYDAEKGKYKVNVKVANEDKSKENNITFYINEPLRGVGDTKDKVFIKDDKVVVQRNCGIRAYEDGDFGAYITDKVNTVYPLVAPTYEEVEYNDTKLFIESFKNSTLSYNSNVPVTSKLYYSYSVPIVDTVAQTANVTDQQDSMIIDLATSVAVMEMMLM